MDIFTDFNKEIRTKVPGVIASGELDNIRPSFLSGKSDVVNVISDDVYNLAATHYNSANYQQPGFEILDELVDLLQTPVALFTYYHYLPFIVARIDDEGITRVENDDRKTAYKYQIDAQAQSFLKLAWLSTDLLLQFLNEKAFTEWTGSDEYAESRTLIYKSYKDFQKWYNIDNSNYFYSSVIQIIKRKQEMELRERIPEFDTIITNYYANTLSADETKLLQKMQQAVAIDVLADACFQLEFYRIPATLRAAAGNNFQKGTKISEQGYLRQTLAPDFRTKADGQYYKLEQLYATQKEAAELIISAEEYKENILLDENPNLITNKSYAIF